MKRNIIKKLKTILSKNKEALEGSELKEYNSAVRLFTSISKMGKKGDANFDKIQIKNKKEYMDVVNNNDLINYKKGIERKINMDKKLDDLNKIDITKDLVIGERKKELSEITGIKQRWMNIFNNKSYFNELYGKMLLHSLLGQLFRNKPIYKGSKKIDQKIHILLVQSSGSGKGEGLRVFKDLVENVNRELEASRKKILRKTGLQSIIELNYSNFAGEETDAVLLSRFGRKEDARKGYDYELTIPGKFEKFDFYIYEEAQDFLEKKAYSQKATNYFLHILEGKTIEKELEKWNGNATKTVGRGSLIAVSRPLSNLSYMLLYSGLFQRCFTILRIISDEEKMDMIKRASIEVSQKASKHRKDKQSYDKEIGQLSKDIVKLYYNLVDKEMDVREPEKINTILMNLIVGLNNRINIELENEEHKNIAKSFVSRYPEIIMKLMYHNSIMRNSRFVEVEDILSAIDLVEESYDLMENWVQESVDYDKRNKYKNNKLINKIRKVIMSAKDNILTLTKAMNILVYGGSERVSKNRSRYLIKKYSDNERQPFIKLKKNKNTYYGLRILKSKYFNQGYK